MVESPYKYVFTAPYSSPMNPIEEVFGSLKKKLKLNDTLNKKNITNNV